MLYRKHASFQIKRKTFNCLCRVPSSLMLKKRLNNRKGLSLEPQSRSTWKTEHLLYPFTCEKLPVCYFTCLYRNNGSTQGCGCGYRKGFRLCSQVSLSLAASRNQLDQFRQSSISRNRSLEDIFYSTLCRSCCTKGKNMMNHIPFR